MTRAGGYAVVTFHRPSNVDDAEPLSCRVFMSPVFSCRYALTDNGGIQEETTYLGIPCLTAQAEKIERGEYKKGKIPLLWDGKTAGRVVEEIKAYR